MHLRTNVKMGEVSHLSDARFAAGAGIEFVGFSLSPQSPQYIQPERVKEIIGWLEGITPIAEWGNEPTEAINDTCRHLGIQYLQLNACNAECSLALKDFILIQNIFLTPHESFSTIIRQVDGVQQYTKYYMLSFAEEGMQDAFLQDAGNEQMITDFCRSYPVFLNFDFHPDSILDVLEKYKPFGINIKGGPEDKPGLKDFDELHEMMDVLQGE